MVLAHLAALSAFSTGELWTCSLKSLDRQVLVEHLSSLWFPLFYKSSVVMIHKHLQEGLFRLWRGTGASLALAVPTVNPFS